MLDNNIFHGSIENKCVWCFCRDARNKSGVIFVRAFARFFWALCLLENKRPYLEDITFTTVSRRWSPCPLKTKAELLLRSEPIYCLWTMRGYWLHLHLWKQPRSWPSGLNTSALFSVLVGMPLRWLWHLTSPLVKAGGTHGGSSARVQAACRSSWSCGLTPCQEQSWIILPGLRGAKPSETAELSRAVQSGRCRYLRCCFQSFFPQHWHTDVILKQQHSLCSQD